MIHFLCKSKGWGGFLFFFLSCYKFVLENSRLIFYTEKHAEQNGEEGFVKTPFLTNGYQLYIIRIF